MIKAIESLSTSSGRRLKKLDYRQSLSIDGSAVVQNHQLLGPEALVEFDRMMDRFVQDDNGRSKIKQVIKIGGILPQLRRRP